MSPFADGPSPRPGGTSLLVCALPDPPADVLRNGTSNRKTSRGLGLTSARSIQHRNKRASCELDQVVAELGSLLHACE
jgi:hypothetical protein